MVNDMGRLTENGTFCSVTDCDYESKCRMKINCYEKRMYDKLKEYEDLEEQGLLLKLPCKCDEVVWVAEKGFKPHKAMYACPSAMLDDIEHGRGIGYTKAEAEKALAEMEK